MSHWRMLRYHLFYDLAVLKVWDGGQYYYLRISTALSTGEQESQTYETLYQILLLNWRFTNPLPLPSNFSHLAEGQKMKEPGGYKKRVLINTGNIVIRKYLKWKCKEVASCMCLSYGTQNFPYQVIQFNNLSAWHYFQLKSKKETYKST